MSDLRKYLILFAVVIGIALLGRFAGEFLLSSIPKFPTWVWWMLFGISMSLICPLKAAILGKGSRFGCSRRHAACSSSV